MAKPNEKKRLMIRAKSLRIECDSSWSIPKLTAAVREKTGRAPRSRPAEMSAAKWNRANVFGVKWGEVT